MVSALGLKKFHGQKNQVQKNRSANVMFFWLFFYLRLAQGHRLGHFLTRW